MPRTHNRQPIARPFWRKLTKIVLCNNHRIYSLPCLPCYRPNWRMICNSTWGSATLCLWAKSPCRSAPWKTCHSLSPTTRNITLISHKRQGVSNCQQLDCLFNRLFKLSTRKHQNVALLAQKSAIQRAFPRHDISLVENKDCYIQPENKFYKQFR